MSTPDSLYTTGSSQVMWLLWPGPMVVCRLAVGSLTYVKVIGWPQPSEAFSQVWTWLVVSKLNRLWLWRGSSAPCANGFLTASVTVPTDCQSVLKRVEKRDFGHVNMRTGFFLKQKFFEKKNLNEFSEWRWVNIYLFLHEKKNNKKTSETAPNASGFLLGLVWRCEFTPSMWTTRKTWDVACF